VDSDKVHYVHEENGNRTNTRFTRFVRELERKRQDGDARAGMFPQHHDQVVADATRSRDLLRFPSFAAALSCCSLFALICHHLSYRANARNWTPGQPSIIPIYGWTKVRYPLILATTRSVVNHCERAGRRKLYSVPSTSMMPSGVRHSSDRQPLNC
jgi:hypothetical protein